MILVFAHVSDVHIVSYGTNVGVLASQFIARQQLTIVATDPVEASPACAVTSPADRPASIGTVQITVSYFFSSVSAHKSV